MIDEVWISI